MEKIQDYKYLIGYIKNGKNNKPIYIKNTPQNICKFIVSDENDKFVYTPDKKPVLDIIGSFVINAFDRNYYNAYISNTLINLLCSEQKPMYELYSNL